MFSFLFNFSKSLEIYENVKKIRYFAKNKVCSDSLNCFCVCDFFLSVQGQIPVFTGGGIRVQRPERALNLSSEKLGRWRKKKGFIFSWSCTGGAGMEAQLINMPQKFDKGGEKQLFLKKTYCEVTIKFLIAKNHLKPIFHLRRNGQVE